MNRTDLTDAATHEARALSMALFRRLGELEEGTSDYSYVRNTLVELNLSLVKFAARRFRARSEPMEDIVQVGTVGLIKAINRFDPDRGVEFTSFALPTITGEIKRFFRDTSWAVKVPRRLQELRIDAAKAHDVLEQELGRPPTVTELAGRLHVTPDELVEGQKAAHAYSARSLDAPEQEDGDQNAYAARPALGEEEAAYDRIECLESLKPVLADLPDRERTLLALRFGQELTQAEIGDRLGLSQMHVSRLLSRTLARLRTVLLTDPDHEPEPDQDPDPDHEPADLTESAPT
ncbi:SigB/SigF/SigG family RNA polymerase sigma factor [Streptomyces sp. ISL-86]|uniref:SigB/SigF/SigG family RNA polymerase sigma factor n=1 Tax=Streptomyces sp. ISL-86 TaxID=2819187 RepID=UPI001BEBF4FA|nr:SigB/SigF/SigG family RNA polymerase sigma factor [Streptomyces sp. ISL-86]MBT2457675.1 SigB/SigF/SigG family RNA polymerase sigma factor [Streptomyces sp. ISL-86]